MLDERGNTEREMVLQMGMDIGRFKSQNWTSTVDRLSASPKKYLYLRETLN